MGSPRKKQNTFIAIDLKSFYASCECSERGLDPLSTNLVVADTSRSDKTICLAVSPSLKACGIPGRPRLFEVVRGMKEVNARRLQRAGGCGFRGSSVDANELRRDPLLKADYIAAVPRMAMYMEYSAKIYGIYLKYIAPEDIHVYSVDEVFIDATPYIDLYGMDARELAVTMVRDVLRSTGITATVGIGTNLYLCKIAMDIEAKHMEPDRDGVRIAELDEMSYRKKLWGHTPITDFWRVGSGTARRLASCGMYTMGDVARCSVGDPGGFYSEDLLFRLFGVNAELLIDHAWGYEPCSMADIKSYVPKDHSLGTGQVLSRPYTFDEGRLIVREMTDLLVTDMVSKGLETDSIVLHVGYDTSNLTDPVRRSGYHGKVKMDHYGRPVPVSARGTAPLEEMTSSASVIVQAAVTLYEEIADSGLLVRRITVTAGRVRPAAEARAEEPVQLDFFTDREAEEKERREKEAARDSERGMQEAIIDIRGKYGKNAILKGMNFKEGATTIERNGQIGGHKA
ncbi:MAG: DNA methylase [Anaerovoracaceae bacterium]|jgi:DNA polymerase V